MLEVSRPRFFSRGVTTACFWDSGSRPWLNDAFTKHMTYGSSRSINSRSRNVGTGSNEHDLTADDMMMRRTSVSEQRRKDGSDDGIESMTVRAGIHTLRYKICWPFQSWWKYMLRNYTILNDIHRCLITNESFRQQYKAWLWMQHKSSRMDSWTLDVEWITGWW